MRKTILAGCTAIALLGAGGAAWISHAPMAYAAPGDMAEGPGPHDGGPDHMPWHHGPGGPGGPGMMHHHRVGELVVPAADRKLTGPDVQKIAESFLLWNGNRDWKVTGVSDSNDGVTFAYSTASGDVVARFKMDKHNGHIERVS